MRKVGEVVLSLARNKCSGYKDEHSQSVMKENNMLVANESPVLYLYKGAPYEIHSGSGDLGLVKMRFRTQPKYKCEKRGD